MGLVVKFFQFLKILVPLMSLIFLVSWLLQFYSPETFEQIDQYLGFVPNIFNDVVTVTADINGIDAPMGYAYVAVILIVIAFIVMKVSDAFELTYYNNELQKETALKSALRQISPLDLANNNKNKSKEVVDYGKINSYYGLFELEMNYLQGFEKKKEDLGKLKLICLKSVQKKLASKYPSLKFSTNAKMFFVSYDFKTLETLVKDIIQLFGVIQKNNEKSLIATELILSFYTTNKKIALSKALNILNDINKLNYKNKVVVTHEIVLRYQNEKNQHFDFLPLGMSVMNSENSSQESELELYQMKNKKTT